MGKLTAGQRFVSEPEPDLARCFFVSGLSPDALLFSAELL